MDALLSIYAYTHLAFYTGEQANRRTITPRNWNLKTVGVAKVGHDVIAEHHKVGVAKDVMAEPSTELPVVQGQEYRVKLGKSFTFPKENAFHTIKCESITV